MQSTSWETLGWKKHKLELRLPGEISIISDMQQWQPTPILLPGKSHGRRSLVGCSPWGREESDKTEQLYFHFHSSEKEMATHSSVLAWGIPGTGEPGDLPSMESHWVGHDWSDLAAAAAVAFSIYSPSVWICPLKVLSIDNMDLHENICFVQVYFQIFYRNHWEQIAHIFPLTL